MPTNCVRCGEPLGIAYISDDGGMAHPKCYWINHPFKPKKSFNEVLYNGDDQVLVRHLVESHCGVDAKHMIVWDFNRIMQDRYNRRISNA